MKAFPIKSPNQFDNEGMDLRDYFAIKVLQSALVNEAIEKREPDSAIDISEYAYLMADAMMKAREQ